MNPKNLNILLLSPYEGHSTAEHLALLGDLKSRGIVDKVTLFRSRLKGFKYPFDVSGMIDREIKGDLPDASLNPSESIKKYFGHLEQMFREQNFDIVIPINDESVYVASKFLNGRLGYLDSSIVELFQNKQLSFDFVSQNGLFRVPSYLNVNSSVSYRDVDQFIRQNEGRVFAKPTRPMRGGGVGIGEIHSLKELEELIRGSPLKGDYLLSEFLEGPEYNQTIIVNSDGKIVTQATYYNSSQSKSSERTICSEGKLDRFGTNFAASLKQNFPGLNFGWSYNMDFLRDKRGNLVLSEVNPGRLPAKLGVYRIGDFNLLEALIFSRDSNFIYSRHPLVGHSYSQEVKK